MIKRMTTKLHLGHTKLDDSEQSQSQLPPLPSPASPSSAQSLSTSFYSQYDQRGSISTERTSASEWSANNAYAAMKRDDAMDYTSDLACIDENSTAPHRKIKLVRRERGTYRLSDFIIHRTLGTGSFGRVHLVRSKHNLRFYAIKVLNKERVVKMKQVEHTNNEQMMLECVQHPFIINLWGTFQDTANLYMVMDFVPGGELFTLLRRSNRFPDPVAKFYAAEVALALAYLHEMNVVYRDLKPENILLNSDGHIKVADFGFAKAVEVSTWTLCGTPDYLAPEVIGQQRYNKSVDWYALGVLIYEMLSGLPPYHHPAISTSITTAATTPTAPPPSILYEKIVAGPAFVPFPPSAFSTDAKDIVLKLMESDPSKRYGNMRHGANDVFAHGWFREVDWVRLERREIGAPYLPRIAGDGDASAFESYPEDNAASAYGLVTPDPWGTLFGEFDYTNPAS